MSAGVEKDNRARLGILKILYKTLDIETLGLGIIISVISDFKASSFEDLLMVGPGRLADVDGSISELVKEVS